MTKKQQEEKKKKIISEHHKKKIKPNAPYIDKKYMDELNIATNLIDKDKIKKINRENYIVVKDNRLIQKATFDFTALEMKCLNYTLSKLKPNEKIDENTWIEYPIKELYQILNINHSSTNAITLLKNSLESISDKSKWLKIDNEKEKKQFIFRFFMKCEITDNNVVRIRFMQELLDYVQGLTKNFTTQYLIFTMRLKSKYAIRLYELCKSYQSNYIKELEIFGFNFYIDKMKMKWCLPFTYKNADIKRILDKAIKEINKKTDINVSIYKTHKTKNKIDYYILRIEPNTYTVFDYLPPQEKSTQ